MPNHGWRRRTQTNDTAGDWGRVVEEEWWRWSSLTVEMRLNCCCSTNTAAVQHMSQAKISLDFKVLIILPWQSAKWTYCADRKMSTRHTRCPHLAAFFEKWNNKCQESQTKPKMKTKPEEPSRWVCVYLKQTFFSTGLMTHLSQTGVQVIRFMVMNDSKWATPSPSLCSGFLRFLWWDEGRKKSKAV